MSGQHPSLNSGRFGMNKVYLFVLILFLRFGLSNDHQEKFNELNQLFYDIGEVIMLRCWKRSANVMWLYKNSAAKMYDTPNYHEELLCLHEDCNERCIKHGHICFKREPSSYIEGFAYTFVIKNVQSEDAGTYMLYDTTEVDIANFVCGYEVHVRTASASIETIKDSIQSYSLHLVEELMDSVTSTLVRCHSSNITRSDNHQQAVIDLLDKTLYVCAVTAVTVLIAITHIGFILVYSSWKKTQFPSEKYCSRKVNSEKDMLNPDSTELTMIGVKLAGVKLRHVSGNKFELPNDIQTSAEVQEPYKSKIDQEINLHSAGESGQRVGSFVHIVEKCLTIFRPVQKFRNHKYQQLIKKSIYIRLENPVSELAPQPDTTEREHPLFE